MTDEAYFRLADFLGIQEKAKPYRHGHTGNYVDNTLLEMLGIDVRFVWLQIGIDLKKISDDTVLDDWGIPIRMVDGYGSRVDPPLRDLDPELNTAEAIEKLEEHPWPDPSDPRRVEGLERIAENLWRNTDACIVARSPQSASFLEYGAWLRGEERFFMDLGIHEEFINRLFDKILAIQIGYYNALLRSVGRYVSVVESSEDYGTSNGLMISPEMFRKYIKPRRAAINRFIKDKCPSVKILHHSCGSIGAIIGDLIETGVDILNPVQPNLPGMDGSILKRDFGRRLCFCGGLDMLKLSRWSDREMVDEIHRCMREYGSDGGYLFSTSNHIQRDVNPERVVTLFRLAREYGGSA